MIEQLFTIFEICIKLFSELVLTPFLNIIHHRLPSKDDEITISINISPAGQRQRDASASSGASGPVKRPPVKKSVTFEEVQIRTYESILGDNPSCSRGPPLAIGWDYTTTPPQTVHVDAYESHPDRAFRPSYAEYDLLMDKKEREKTLMKLGYTRADLAAATRQNLKAKKKRRQTADNLSVAYMEEKVEGIKKSLKRHVLFKKGTKSMYKDWQKVLEKSGMDESQHYTAQYAGRRHSDQDEWGRTQSVLVLGRRSSMVKHAPPEFTKDSADDDVLSQSTGEETLEDDNVMMPMSTEQCKLSAARRGYPSFKNKISRRASM